VDTTRVAVLACLHLADQLESLEQQLAELRNKVEDKAREFQCAVGQDGILRPIGNRPATEFGIIYGPITNRPQVTNLPHS